jgi:hypothetical protein
MSRGTTISSYLRHRIEPAPDPVAVRRRLHLRWWREALYALAFYVVYSAIRNQFGSASVSPTHALEHARQIVDLERSMHLFVEEAVQSFFVTAGHAGQLEFHVPGARLFLEFWNIFYGTFHFLVTAFAMVWLFRRFPTDYPGWRNTLAFTTAFALIGFSLYPLMPPRLLTDCGPYGACLSEYDFIDTLADIGGLWSFDSGTMQKVSNQYAAMPSLHFAWSTWCALVLFPRVRRPWLRALTLLYPVLTLWAIVVTANHYWLDAVGGAIILTAGYLCGMRLARFTTRRHLAEDAGSHLEVAVPATGGSVVTEGASGYGADHTVWAATDTDRRPPSPHVPRDDH